MVFNTFSDFLEFLRFGHFCGAGGGGEIGWAGVCMYVCEMPLATAYRTTSMDNLNIHHNGAPVPMSVSHANALPHSDQQMPFPGPP